MKNDRRSSAPESFTAGSVGFVQKRSIPNVIVGMLCRFIVAFTGVSGVCIMLDDAFGFTGEFRLAPIMLVCLALCAAWFVFFVLSDINGIAFAVTGAVYLSALIFGVVQLGFKETFLYVPLSTWNHLLARLDALGFSALSGLKSSLPGCDPLTEQGAYYASIGFYAFCGLISFIFVSCLYKKVKAIPVIISAGIVMTVTFTYNLISENFGFLLTVSSGFGILVLLHNSTFMKRKDEEDQPEPIKKFKNKREELVRASAPGLAALLAVVIVFSVGAYPASRISKPAPEITVLYDVIDEVREFFSRYLTGGGGSGEGYEAERKSTEPTPRNFEGKKMLTVTAEYPSAVYLRAWIAESYTNDKWMSASVSERDINILPEQITELFYTVVDIDANVFADTGSPDTDYRDRGFVKERVTVRSDALSGGTGILASRYSALYGVTDTETGKSRVTASSFNNGVGTVEFAMRDAKYSTVAYTPNYKNVSLQTLDSDMMIYNAVLPYIVKYAEKRLNGEMSGEELDRWLANAKIKITEDLAENGVALPAGSLINRVSSLSSDDLKALVSMIEEARKYESYVYENCVYVPWSDERTLTKAAREAFGGTAGDLPSEIYSCANKAARYLERNCEYDLSPKGYTDRGSYIGQFLTSAKNGYCIQYASAGALMLRTAGIPTRYVDGFLASDFYIKEGKYYSAVYDNNAHAWIEVYVRGYGWMTFEMTEPMLDGLYRTPGQTVFETETDTAETTAETSDVTTEAETSAPVTRPRDSLTLPETTTEQGGGGKTVSAKTLMTVGIVFLCVLFVSTLIYVFMKKTSNKAKKRQDMFDRALRGESTDPESDIDEISRYIFYLFGHMGLHRSDTELMKDFVKRADDLIYYKSFAPAARAIQKNAFGHCADANDCRDAADYAVYLRKNALNRLTLFETIWYCEVLKKI